MAGSSTNNKIVANNVWAGQLYLEDKFDWNQLYLP